MTDDPIIDRSEAQKTARVEQLRAELAELGYSIIRKGDMTTMNHLAKAQAEYDAAVAERGSADKIVNDAAKKVIAATKRLEDAKRDAAAPLLIGALANCLAAAL
ncbi:hypothetical protein ACRQ5Q_17055 [Bradyrhizobium sp. PMVTL-01]|uniref:hypothetical protein n=1 Tax=Bradyrhizobium sp. PMVTL-01 TaxID=3434999 RepID=UPI003F72791A